MLLSISFLRPPPRRNRLANLIETMSSIFIYTHAAPTFYNNFPPTILKLKHEIHAAANLSRSLHLLQTCWILWPVFVLHLIHRIGVIHLYQPCLYAQLHQQRTEKSAYNGQCDNSKCTKKPIWTRAKWVNQCAIFFSPNSKLLNAPPIAFSFIEWKTVKTTENKKSATARLHCCIRLTGDDACDRGEKWPSENRRDKCNKCMCKWCVLCLLWFFTRWREMHHTIASDAWACFTWSLTAFAVHM